MDLDKFGTTVDIRNFNVFVMRYANNHINRGENSAASNLVYLICVDSRFILIYRRIPPEYY